MSVNREIIGYLCDGCGAEALHDTNPGTDPDIPRGWVVASADGRPRGDHFSGQHLCPDCAGIRTGKVRAVVRVDGGGAKR
jgi:hypothetical protein